MSAGANRGHNACIERCSHSLEGGVHALAHDAIGRRVNKQRVALQLADADQRRLVAHSGEAQKRHSSGSRCKRSHGTKLGPPRYDAARRQMIQTDAAIEAALG